MGLESVFTSLINLFSRKAKYKECAETHKLYYEVYARIFELLMPYFIEYKEDENLLLALNVSVEILDNNIDLINPYLLISFQNVLSDIENRIPYNTSSERKLKKYQKLNVEEKAKKDEEYRRQAFYWLANDFLKEYNSVREAVGIGKMKFTHMCKFNHVKRDDLDFIFRLFIKIMILIIIGTIIYFIRGFI